MRSRVQFSNNQGFSRVIYVHYYCLFFRSCFLLKELYCSVYLLWHFSLANHKNIFTSTPQGISLARKTKMFDKVDFGGVFNTNKT